MNRIPDERISRIYGVQRLEGDEFYPGEMSIALLSSNAEYYSLSSMVLIDLEGYHHCELKKVNYFFFRFYHLTLFCSF